MSISSELDAIYRGIAGDPRFLPQASADHPRYSGVATFMRLPHILTSGDDPLIEAVDIGLIGVPFDGGTTNRPGARHGPRQVRDAAAMIRMFNQITRVRPFHMSACADLGDSPVNPADVGDTLERVFRFYDQVRARRIVPLSVGGDHLISLPILRAMAGHSPPLAVVQFDAHTDLFDSYFGGMRYTHGTPFRRAIEEGLVDPKCMVQIGIRGTGYDGEDVDWGRSQGVQIVMVDELMEQGIDATMEAVRSLIGDRPVYVSFDIDVIDPSMAPGTGTPEIGGISTLQAQQMIRGLSGLKIVGADLVEVSPPFDPGGGTAWAAANLLFELLCVISERLWHERQDGGSSGAV